MSFETLFNADDETAFVQLATQQLDKSAATNRGISPGEYISLAREVWRSCTTDQVYAIKLLMDPVVAENPADFPDEYTRSGRPFCALIARIGHNGELIDAPPGYVRPSFPGVYYAHLPFGSPSGSSTADFQKKQDG